jgi:diguanylate cyclase (GGDEF)-like protein
MDTAPITALLVAHPATDTKPVHAAAAGTLTARVGIPRVTVRRAERDLAEDVVSLDGEGVDVILLDLGRESGAGLEALHRVRARAPGVPVVVLTRAGGDGDTAGFEAVQAGAQDFIPMAALRAPLLARALRYAIDRHNLQDTLRQLSLSDPLTGLYNRRGFLTLSVRHLQTAHRTRGLLLALADVDGLAAINALYGRAEGDRALVRSAKMLRDAFRASDVIARLEEDTFAVLVLDAAAEMEELVSRRLRSRAEAGAAGAPLPLLSLTVGTARVDPDSVLSVNEALARAAAALAERKRLTRHG